MKRFVAVLQAPCRSAEGSRRQKEGDQDLQQEVSCHFWCCCTAGRVFAAVICSCAAAEGTVCSKTGVSRRRLIRSGEYKYLAKNLLGRLRQGNHISSPQAERERWNRERRKFSSFCLLPHACSRTPRHTLGTPCLAAREIAGTLSGRSRWTSAPPGSRKGGPRQTPKAPALPTSGPSVPTSRSQDRFCRLAARLRRFYRRRLPLKSTICLRMRMLQLQLRCDSTNIGTFWLEDCCFGPTESLSVPLAWLAATD